MRVNATKAFNAFMQKKAAKPAKSIWTDGFYLYSYGTILAAHTSKGEVRFNGCRYSVTTTVHQNALRAAFQQAGVTLIESDDRAVWGR